MTIALNARLSRPVIQEGSPAALYLALQIQAPADLTATRPPLNLAAVLDRSGSMHGAKLAYTKTALRFLVGQTLPTDALALVTFDDEVQTLEPTLAAVAAIEAGGSTNLSGGLLAGYKATRAQFDKARINRVLLLTDGQANVGITDPAALAKKAAQIKEQGIGLSTLGVGADFNEDLLAAMAEAGGGNFHFIANPDEIPAIFAEELQGLLATVAQGLDLTFRAAPGVTVASVIGYPPRGTPHEVKVALPDLHAGETKTLILALEVDPAFAGDHLLGHVHLNGEEVDLSLDVTVTVADSTAPEDSDVLKEVHLARAAEAQQQAIDAADRNDRTTAAQILRSAAAPLAFVAQNDATVQERLADLSAQAQALESETYDAVTRKQMKAQAFRNRPGRR
ncbi:MAG TPA: VWA domain-containing protein [Symbiobacteriaceae bacterium]|nr:VWA domain-containing protein [Symbiobacteriaceae bacterium]